MKKIKVIGLLGRSGTGKNTVVDSLRVMFGEHVHMPLLTTSRPKRPLEIEGREYHFVSKEKALQDILDNKSIWHSCFNDWYYYLPADSLNPDKLNLLVLNPSAAVQMSTKNLELRLFELTVPDKELWIRLSSRPDLIEVARRWSEDLKDFAEPHYTALPICKIQNNNSIITSYMLYNYIVGMEDGWAKNVKPSIWNPNIYTDTLLKNGGF